MKQHSFTVFPRSIFMRPWRTHISAPWLIAGGISALGTSFYFGAKLAPLTGPLNGIIIASAAGIVLFCGTAALSPFPGDLCSKIGLRKVSFRDLLLCLGGLLLILGGSALLTAFWQQLLEYFQIPFAREQSLLQLARSGEPKTLLQLLVLTVLLVPVLEELVFRRALYGVLLKLGAPAAMMGTSLIFAAAHGFLLGFPGLFFMGTVFQCIANRTRNLWCSIIVHAMLNCTVILFASAGAKAGTN